jgi:hypothetical protein
VGCSDGDLDIARTALIRSPIRASVCTVDLDRNRVVGPGSGVGVDLSSSVFTSRITATTVTGWGTAVLVGYGSAVITGSTLRQNGTAITCVTGPCSGTIIDNSIRDNLGTGIELATGTWHIGSNTAVRNGGLGIHAEGPGLTVIDEGGNVARRNQPPQCIGVVCTPHP